MARKLHTQLHILNEVLKYNLIDHEEYVTYKKDTQYKAKRICDSETKELDNVGVCV